MESSNLPNNAISETAKENILIQNGNASEHSKPLEEHTLLNPLVVDKIVEQLNPTFEQLKTLRLISKIWSEATLHHWRNSSAAITLIPDPNLFTKTKYTNGFPISQFIREFQNPQSLFQLASKPFSNYKFKGHTFDIQVCNEIGGPAKAFWDTVGPLIESLHFENCSFLKHCSLEKATCPMAELLVGLIPNVKNLVLNQVKVQEPDTIYLQEGAQVSVSKPLVNLRTLTVYGDLEEGDVSLESLLKMTPNLESIKGLDLPNVKMSKTTLIQPICEVRFKTPEMFPAPLSNLKHLDLLYSSTFLGKNNSWASLTPSKKNEAGNVTQLPLESLALQLKAIQSRFGTDYQHVNKYLTSFAATLKTLKVYRAPVGLPYFTFLSGSFGEMSVLTELHLWGTIAPHLGFLRSTPNLKILRIDLGCVKKGEEMKDWIRDHDEIEKYKKYRGDMALQVPYEMKEAILCLELELLEIDFKFPEKSLRLLGRWMPNLKSLKTILNGRTVPVVCEVWRDLNELVCLHGSKIGNNCFIRNDKEAGSFSGGPPAELKICDLKELERFQLDTYCGESELTDAAVFKGFLKMSGLKSVQICVGDKMSEKAEEALKKGIQFCEFVRNDEKVDVKMADDDYGVDICGCYRCVFRSETEKGFRVSDDDDKKGESLSSGGRKDNVEMPLQLDDLDEHEAASRSDDDDGDGGN